jgi:hypothetical protein
MDHGAPRGYRPAASTGQQRIRKDGTVPVNASVLTGSIAGLADLDPTLGLTHTLQRAVNATERLFGVDGAGMMLADPDGRLRWAVASDQRVQLAGDYQEVLAQGPARWRSPRAGRCTCATPAPSGPGGRSPCGMSRWGCRRR